MKKFILPAVIILALAFLYFRAKPQGPGSQSGQSQEQAKAESFSGSLIDAVKLGIGMKCTYQLGDTQMEALIKGKRYRGKVEAQGVTSEIAMDDTCMWSWVSDQQTGFKTCYDPDEADTELWDIPSDAEMSGETPDVAYNCQPAVITDEQLNPPPGIEFMSLEQMMQMAPSN